MNRLLTITLTLFSMQTYAVTGVPNNSIPHSIQESLTRPAHLFYWNEGAWIDSIKMPYGVSEGIKAELLSKPLDEWMDIAAGKDKDKALEARSAIGVSYLYGIGVKQDAKFGLSFLKGAANKGRAVSALHTAMAHAIGVGDLTEDYVEALDWYKLADKLNKTGENKFDLGAMYMRAAEQATVRKDYKKAVEIHKEALEYGNTDSTANLVAHYLTGLGVEKNVDKALEYAKQVDVKTLFNNDNDYNRFGSKLTPETIVGLINLNTAYLNKDTYTQEYYNAMLMLSKSVNQSDPVGAYIAAKTAYTVKDYNFYSYALKVAADNGLPVAQYELANELDKIDKPEKALELYKDAAEGGYEPAFVKYGSALYDKGNHKEALYWLDRAIDFEVGSINNNGKPYTGAATDGYIQSTELLAKLYFNGEGVEHNKDKALELVDDLIKQVNGRISMTKIQANPDAEWKRDKFNSKDWQVRYYYERLGGYIDKHSELVKLKDRIKGE